MFRRIMALGAIAIICFVQVGQAEDAYFSSMICAPAVSYSSGV